MKRTFLSLLLIILFFVPSLACGTFVTRVVEGSGHIVSQGFVVGGFDRITLRGSGDVYIEQGETENLSIEADDNIISALDIRIRGRELILGVKRGFDIDPSQPIRYNLAVKDLRSIMLAGSGSFHVGRVESDDLNIAIPGSGDIHIQNLSAKDLLIDLDGSGNITVDNINVKTIDTSLRGSGNIELKGQTKEERVEIRGSGNYQAEDLWAKAARVSIPGSGNVTLWVIKELRISGSGSSNIQYYGNPLIKQIGGGSGDITSLGEK